MVSTPTREGFLRYQLSGTKTCHKNARLALLSVEHVAPTANSAASFASCDHHTVIGTVIWQRDENMLLGRYAEERISLTLVSEAALASPFDILRYVHRRETLRKSPN